MEFKIVKHGPWNELVDKWGFHRIVGENTNCPYILIDPGDEARYRRINLLPDMKRTLKAVMEGQA